MEKKDERLEKAKAFLYSDEARANAEDASGVNFVRKEPADVLSSNIDVEGDPKDASETEQAVVGTPEKKKSPRKRYNAMRELMSAIREEKKGNC